MEEKEIEKLKNKLTRVLNTNRKLRIVYQLNKEFKARNEVLKAEIMRMREDIEEWKTACEKLRKANKKLDEQNFKLLNDM